MSMAQRTPLTLWRVVPWRSCPSEKQLKRGSGCPVVLVDDAGRALATAASVVYGRPSSALKVVGITGTNGKTTTAYLVRSAVDGAR